MYRYIKSEYGNDIKPNITKSEMMKQIYQSTTYLII